MALRGGRSDLQGTNIISQMLKNDSHAVRCHAIDLLDAHIGKSQTVKSNKLAHFQLDYFFKRKKDPTTTQIVNLNKGLRRFADLVLKDQHKEKMAASRAFNRWRGRVFGAKKEILNIFKAKLKQDLRKVDATRAIFSYRNLSRLRNRAFQAFHKWKSMVRLGYPLVKRNQELGKTSAYTMVFNHANKIDQSAYYKGASTLFHYLTKIFGKPAKDFFVFMEIGKFMQVAPNSKFIAAKSVLPLEYVQFSETMPAILAAQILKNGYKRTLLAAFIKLQGQSKLITMRDRVRKAKSDWKVCQHRARAELLLKIFVRALKQKLRRRFAKWRLQTQLRSATVAIMREAHFDDKNDGSNDKRNYREAFHRIKRTIDEVAKRYSYSMARSVIVLLKEDPVLIKEALNSDFQKCVEEVMESF